MPRPPRLHVPTAFYHVTLRGNHREPIFRTHDDRELMTGLFSSVSARFSAKVHAYCYMTNHIHALIQVADVPLGRLILRIAGRYARSFQAAIPTTGHLFEKRYHAVLVDADEYLLAVIRYIHLNPVRAGMVASPDDYRWSSHHVYSGQREEAWITTDVALRMLHCERSRAIDAYRSFVMQGLVHSGPSPLSERHPDDSRLLGGDQFAGTILRQAWTPRSLKSTEDLVAEGCERYSVTLETLTSPSRRPLVVEARAWIAHQALLGRVASLSAIARLFNRDESSLRQAMRRYFNYP